MPRAVDVPRRRDDLVGAVWAVAARHGLEAVTARSVAAEAGLSLGAVTRTFATQDQLHLVALQQLVARVTTRLADRPALADPLARAEDLLAQVVPLTDATATEAAVYYGYLSRARTQPALLAVADEVDQALARLCRQVVDLIAPDLPDAARRAAELHALTEGLSLGLATWPHRRGRADAADLVHRWLAGLQAGTATAEASEA